MDKQKVGAHIAESHSQKWRAMGKPSQASEMLQLAAYVRDLEKRVRELEAKLSAVLSIPAVKDVEERLQEYQDRYLHNDPITDARALLHPEAKS